MSKSKRTPQELYRPIMFNHDFKGENQCSSVILILNLQSTINDQESSHSHAFWQPSEGDKGERVDLAFSQCPNVVNIRIQTSGKPQRDTTSQSRSTSKLLTHLWQPHEPHRSVSISKLVLAARTCPSRNRDPK